MDPSQTLDSIVALVHSAVRQHGWDSITNQSGVSRHTINRFRSSHSLLATKPKLDTIRKVAEVCDPDPATAPRRWQTVIANAGVRDTEPASANPYKGLLPYGIKDAPVLFGRTREVAILTRWVEEGLNGQGNRILSIEGPTGSGKTSLMFAGLGAALSQRTDLQVALVLPSEVQEEAAPGTSLREAVRRRIEDALREQTPAFSVPKTNSTAELAEFLSDKRIVLGIDEFEYYLADKLRWQTPMLDLLAELHNRCRSLCLSLIHI